MLNRLPGKPARPDTPLRPGLARGPTVRGRASGMPGAPSALVTRPKATTLPNPPRGRGVSSRDARAAHPDAPTQAVRRIATYLEIPEQTAPGTPPANRMRFYTKDVAGVTHFFTKDDAGNELDVTAAAGGSGPSAASQAEMEAASSTSVYASPGRVGYHPGVAKAWVHFTGTGTVTVNTSLNVSSVTDNGVGVYTVNFTVAFSSANYAGEGSCDNYATNAGICLVGAAATQAAGSCNLVTVSNNATGTASDMARVRCSFFGDQ